MIIFILSSTVFSSSILSFSSGQMVINQSLNILLSINTNSTRVVSWTWCFWIDIHNFSISFVFEQQTTRTIGNNLIIPCWITGTCLRFPIVKTQIRAFWQHSFLSTEITGEIFVFESASIINVPRDFLTSSVLVSDKNDAGHSSCSVSLFPFSQSG